MFLLICLLSPVRSACPSYSCANSYSETCVLYDPAAQTSQVYSCAPGSSCSFNHTSPNQNSYCTAQPPAASYPGERCEKSSECLYGVCDPKSKLCTGFERGKICNLTLQCSPGLYCKASSTSSIQICSPLIQPGDAGCSNSSDCSALAYCNYSNTPETSKCLASLSFAAGTKVALCYSGINYMCQSLKCVTIRGINYCSSAVTSAKSLPTRCEQDRDCTSISDVYVGQFYTESCTCGVNAKGLSYCPLFPGDVIYGNYIFYLSLWMNSQKITKCNSRRRMELPCLKSHLTTYEYHSLVYYMYMTLYYPYIQGNMMCVKETLNSVFWESEQYMAAEDVSSFDPTLSLLWPIIILSQV